MTKIPIILTEKIGELEMRIHNHLDKGKNYFNSIKKNKEKNILIYLEYDSRNSPEEIIRDFKNKYSFRDGLISKSPDNESFYSLILPQESKFKLKEKIINYFPK